MTPRAGLHLMAMVGISRPSWDGGMEVDAATDGIGTYPDEAMAGSVFLVLAPSVGARYSF